jgi:hypothetical protein
MFLVYIISFAGYFDIDTWVGRDFGAVVRPQRCMAKARVGAQGAKPSKAGNLTRFRCAYSTLVNDRQNTCFVHIITFLYAAPYSRYVPFLYELRPNTCYLSKSDKGSVKYRFMTTPLRTILDVCRDRTSPYGTDIEYPV